MTIIAVVSRNPGADISVYDATLVLVASGRDSLTAEVEAGLYRVSAHGSGGDDTQIVEAPPEGRVLFQVGKPAHPLLPLDSLGDGHAMRDRDFSAMLSDLKSARWPRTSALTVVMRSSSGRQSDLPGQQFALLDPGRVRVRRFDKARRLMSASDFSATSVNLVPGLYTFQHAAPGEGLVEQVIYMQRGWRTIVVIPATSTGLSPAHALVTMSRLKSDFDDDTQTERLLLAESAFAAMRDGRPPFVADQSNLLKRYVTEDPMLAVLAVSQVMSGDKDGFELKDGQDLLHLLMAIMPLHPDVRRYASHIALTAAPASEPPMLAASQRLSCDLVDGSYAALAAGAAFDSGIWSRWMAPTSAPDKGTSAHRLEGVDLFGRPLSDFESSALSRLSVSSARGLRVGLSALVWRLSCLLPERFRSGIASQRAATSARALTNVALSRLVTQASVLAHHLRRSPAMTLANERPGRLVTGTTVPVALARELQAILSPRLGVDMSTTSEASVSEPGAGETGMTTLASITAIGALVFFGALALYMIVTSDVSDDVWQRKVYVYASVEAIVFAAAGALFGVQVKRGEAKAANVRAEQAEQEASEAKKSERLSSEDAQKGRTMAATARGLAKATSTTDSSGQQTPGTPGSRGVAGGGMSSGQALEALSQVADELFPRDRPGDASVN